MLKVTNVNTFYGKVQALHDVSIEVNEGEIISIIGANGAGKSTLMKTITGIETPKSGTVEFCGKNITNRKPHLIVEDGIAYVPEGREIFPSLTVEDNLEMGAFCRKLSRNELNETREEMYEIFPRLKERRKQMAGSLSGGEQQMVAIARGLMSNPKLIMFDEPSLGLAPVIVDEVFDIVQRINRERNIPVLIVEQNAYMAMSISQRCYVLENGVVRISGDSKDLINNPHVKAAYLGG